LFANLYDFLFVMQPKHPLLLSGRWHVSQYMIKPGIGQFFLNRVLSQAFTQVTEVHFLKALILIKTTIDESFSSAIGVDMLAHALGANAFHHALHWRID